MLLSQTAEHVDKVDRRHVASLLEKIWRRVCDEFTISAADVDHCVDTDGLHVCEVLIPFFLAPVLVRDVVGNFVEEGSGDAEPVVLRDDETSFCGLVTGFLNSICR